MSEEVEDEPEVSETFTLIQPPKPIAAKDLPQSPKSAFLAATDCGWEVRAALSIGEFAPTLYVGSTDDHSAGDVYRDGYRARIFTVQARDLALDIAFRAQYVGKVYADGRKSGAGSFDGAHVSDPVGVPRKEHVEYKPIKQDRGKYETASSFMRRQVAAKKAADEMTATYNDGFVWYRHTAFFATSGEFTSWLAEWRSFARPTAPTKKAKSNA